ncbi:hypothetical protein Hypma_014397 [Hypsizygus marmoreus]|uniref:Uncharacterized protein n=1 Tax=Hypsizygus marmoreus TaxID=39966 RepID=A0A369JHW5_HYPMA|nr:hypothetical protein Hypma_014397 [Hypsizygus marmoreus]
MTTFGGLLTRSGALFAQIEVLIIKYPQHRPELVSQILNASAHLLRVIEFCAIFEDLAIEDPSSHPIIDFGSMPNLNHVILHTAVSNRRFSSSHTTPR